MLLPLITIRDTPSNVMITDRNHHAFKTVPLLLLSSQSDSTFYPDNVAGTELSDKPAGA